MKFLKSLLLILTFSISVNAKLPDAFNAMKIESIAQFEDKVSHNMGKNTLLIVRADWCPYCKRLEATTYLDKMLQAQLKDFLILEVDITRKSKDERELMKFLGAYGTPTMIFFDKKGKESGERVQSYISADDLMQLLKKI